MWAVIRIQLWSPYDAVVSEVSCLGLFSSKEGAEEFNQAYTEEELPYDAPVSTHVVEITKGEKEC